MTQTHGSGGSLPPSLNQLQQAPKIKTRNTPRTYRNSKRSTSTGTFLPSLSRGVSTPGKPPSRYIPPNTQPLNPSPSFLLPPLPEIVEDLERCSGNIDIFLQAACKDATLHERLLFDIVQAFHKDEAKYREFQELMAASHEARKLRMQESVVVCLETLLKQHKATPAILQMVLKDAPVRTVISQTTAPPPPSPAKPATEQAQSDSVTSFLAETDQEDDSTEEG